MEALFAALPETGTGWVAATVLLLIGGFTIYDRFFEPRGRRLNKATQQLIETLEKQVAATNGDLAATQAEMGAMQSALKHEQTEKASLKGSLKVLQDLLLGRDENTQAVMKEAPLIFEIARSTNQLVTGMSDGITHLIGSVERLSDTVERHIEATKSNEKTQQDIHNSRVS